MVDQAARHSTHERTTPGNVTDPSAQLRSAAGLPGTVDRTPGKDQRCRLLALSGHQRVHCTCPLLVVKQTSRGLDAKSVNDPQDQGASKPFNFITANDVGDEINDAKAFAAWI